MIKRITILTLLIAIAYFYYSCTHNLTANQPEQISGAYDALNALGAQRTYPYKTLPPTAHYAAWEQAKLKQEKEKSNRSTDPWESMGPHNFGGRTLSIAFNPQNTQTMYIGSASGGLWRTYTAGDGAQAWHQINTGFPVLGVSTIAIHPQDSMQMYIGTGEVYNYEAAGTGPAYRNTRGSYGMGILKSTDGGITWTKSLDWTYAQNRGIWAVKIDPSNPDVVWAATTDGTYKSTNAGTDWTKVHEVIMANDLVINPLDANQIIVACGNFASDGNGIYKTNDGGLTWNKLGNPIPEIFNGKIQINYAPSQPSVVYASVGNGFSSDEGASWLLRSDDFGETWQLKSEEDYSRWQGWFAHDVAVNPNDPDKVTVIGIEVWQSDNQGNMLERITEGGANFGVPQIGCENDGNFVHSDAHDVIYHPTDSDIIYIAHDGGISKSYDGGLSFSTCSGGYQTVQFYNGFSSSAQDPNWAMGGLQDNGTIVYDGDKTWGHRCGGDGSWTAIDPTGDFYYCSSQFLFVNRVNTFTNEFEFIRPPVSGFEPLAFITPYVLAPSRPSYLYAASSKVYVSFDYGDNWQTTNGDEELDQNPVLSMAVSPLNEDIVYVGTAPFINEAGLFATIDKGETWNNITEGLPNRFPMDIAVDPNNSAVAYVVFSGYGTGHVFKTLNFGQDWIDVTADLPDVPTNAVVVDPFNSAHVYIGNDIGVFVSEDRGQTWEAYQDGLPTALMVFDLNISPVNRKLRIASHGNGAYQRDLLQFVNVSNKNIAAETLNLNLYPNPTAEQLNLSYKLKKAAKVRFTITDIQGKTIYRSTSQSLTKGEQLTTYGLKEFTSGLYFVTLRIDNQSVTSKFQVLN